MNTLTRENLSISLESACTDVLGSCQQWMGEKFTGLLGLLRRYHAVAKQRHALGQLTDEQLKDIGVSRVDALREASKPFWR